MRIGRVAVLSAVVLFATAASLAAQSTALLRGRVLDPDGGVIVGARIIARSAITGIDRTVITDRAGGYQLAALPPDSYRVTVQAAGFQSIVIESITLAVSTVSVRDFRLQVASVSQELTVSADRPPLERATVSIGHTVDIRTLQQAPLNGRNLLDLSVLVAGSVTPPQNGFLTSPSRAQGFQALNTAGNREDMVNIQINGVTLNDQVNNILLFQPPLAAIDQFRIQNAVIGAEYGRNAGAAIDIVTRSGTNTLSGGVFEFIRDSALDARNYFETSVAPLRRDQFGGFLQGPLRQNTTFFHITYEGLRQKQGLTVNSVVLRDDERAQISSPVIASLAALLPRANAIDERGTGRFVGDATASVATDRWSLDLTHVLSARDRLHGFYALQNDRRREPLALGNTLPGFGDTRDGIRQVLTIEETSVLSARAVNQLRGGFSRIDFTGGYGTPHDPAAFGLADARLNGLPQISVAGAFNIGGPSQLPQGRTDIEAAVADTANVILNRHALRFGGEWRRFWNDNYLQDAGTLTFPSVASFIANQATSFSILAGNRLSDVAQSALSVFAQDTFRWKPNLTFDVGLRYDWHMTPREREDRFVVFDATRTSLLQLPRDADVYKQNRNVLPRAGVIWAADEDTVVRAGFAVHAEQPLTNAVLFLAANPPFATPLAIAGVVRAEDALARAQTSGLAPITIDPEYKNSLVRSWTTEVSRSLPGHVTLSATYVGSRGVHLRLSRNINQPVNGVRPYIRLSSDSPIEPGRALGNITQVESSGASRYHALWITASRPMRQGFQVGATYALSKSRDTNSRSSPPTTIPVQNSYDVDGDWGLSDFDVRHRTTLTAVYNTPWRHVALSDWTCAIVFQAQSGNPVNLVTNNSTLTGVPNTVRPNVTGPVRIVGDVNQWFDTSAFSAGSTFGTLGRNVVIGPGFATTDVSLSRRLRLGGRRSVDLRADAFNVFNRPNFGQPGRIVGTPDFGRITSTRFATGDSGSSRQLQFSLSANF
ncbi:MAG TPA: TonB-dependent receptor [Vicinamibacterales bacterium]|nr:TonB-dependent receptor [Vicinamibacterales bacterium]